MIKCKIFGGYFNKVEVEINKFLESINLDLENFKFRQSGDYETGIILTLFYQIK